MSTTISYTLTREIDDEEIEIEVTVEFEYQKAWRGSRDRYGMQLEPDEPENAEILSIVNEAGQPVETTEDENADIIEKCIDYIHGLKEEAEIDRYLDRYDY